MNQILRLVLGSTLAVSIAWGAQSASAQTTNPSAAVEDQKEKATISIRDNAFLKRSAQANLLGAKIAQLASEHGNSPEVKAWGQKTAQDRNEAYQQITRLAQTKGATVPTTLNTRQQRTLDRLAARSGADFDKAVLQHSIKASEIAVRTTQAESKQGQDPDIKQYATTVLPGLQADLKQTRKLVAKARNAIREPAGSKK